MKRGAIAWAVLGLAFGWSMAALWRGSAQGGEGPAAEQKGEESPNVRYARAALRLAQVTLQEANEANQRMPKTVPETDVSRLDQNARLAELQLKAALDPSIHGFHGENLLLAESAIKVAEADYQKALQANKKFPGAVGKSKLERLRLEVEVSRLHLEREKTLGEDTASRMTELHWQLEQLRDEVLHLRSRVEQLSELN